MTLSVLLYCGYINYLPNTKSTLRVISINFSENLPGYNDSCTFCNGNRECQTDVHPLICHHILDNI